MYFIQHAVITQRSWLSTVFVTQALSPIYSYTLFQTRLVCEQITIQKLYAI